MGCRTYPLTASRERGQAQPPRAAPCPACSTAAAARSRPCTVASPPPGLSSAPARPTARATHSPAAPREPLPPWARCISRIEALAKRMRASCRALHITTLGNDIRSTSTQIFEGCHPVRSHLCDPCTHLQRPVSDVYSSLHVYISLHVSDSLHVYDSSHAQDSLHVSCRILHLGL